MLKVLLVSPIDPEIPDNLKFLMGGENTYTRTLLTSPPPGVKYIHHTQALKEGLIEYLPIQKVLKNLVKFRILPTSAGTQAFLVKSKFDLIHSHVYSFKAENYDGPIILSDSSSNYLFLRDYINWPEWRIAAQFKLRKLIFDKFGISDPDTNLKNVSKLIVFSEFAKDVHLKLGALAEKIEVVYPGIEKPSFAKKQNKGKINILFVGIWFERKGGPLFLEAFKKLCQKHSNIKLTIIGPVPNKYQINNPKIYQRDFVPREKLMREFFPKADIFVLVPPVAEGFGFVVLEAASFGIPAVVSRVYALPEIVEDGKTGFVIEPNNFNRLVARLEELIRNRNLRFRLGMAAQKRFEERFLINVTNTKVLATYQSALNALRFS